MGDPLAMASFPLSIIFWYGVLGMPAMFALGFAYAWLEDRGINITDAAGIAGWLLWPAALILIASDVVVLVHRSKQPPRATARYRTNRTKQ